MHLCFAINLISVSQINFEIGYGNKFSVKTHVHFHCSLIFFVQIISANDASKHGGLQAQPAPSAINLISVSHINFEIGYGNKFSVKTHLFDFIYFLQINSANDASKHGGLQAQPAPSAIDRCETFCDERGCHCLTDQDRPFSQIDHLTVEARNGGRIACFCGSFAVSIINHLPTYINLLLTYVAPFFNVTRVVRFQFLEQCIKDTFATAVG